MTRFIVTGLGRCGSNLLKFALKQNPSLHMVGEYFNPNSFKDIEDQDGAERAEDFFKKFERKFDAVGFKIFLHQGSKGNLPSVWNYLENDTEIKVIHNYRENAFKRIVSLYVAQKTGDWLHKDKDNTHVKIRKKPQWWLEKIKEDIDRTHEIDRIFENHDVHKISYEDLTQNWDESMHDIQIFLGLEPHPVTPKLTKQETLPLHERCPNLPSISRTFRNTEYYWMLNE